ncbi:MAG: CoA-binding protein, partial [Sphingobacteriales bacterium]
YSFMAIDRLRAHGHSVVAVGRKQTVVKDVMVETEIRKAEDIDTVTLYLNPDHQQSYYDEILALHPRRIIFNPGTENPELADLAVSKGIEAVEACTLVMLATHQY